MLAASVCWSFAGLFLTYVPWDAMTVTGMRSLFAALVFVIYRRSVKIKFTKGNLVTGVSLSLTTTLFVFANKLTTSAAAILLQFTAPIFIILIQLVFYKVKPRPREMTAVTLTICGMLLFFADQLDGGSVLGNILAIASGLTFACVFVCNKREDTVPEQALFLGFIINIIVGIPFAAASLTPDPVAWGAIAFLGVIQVGMAYIFFSIGIKRTPALLGCLITALEPILNPTWVAIFTGLAPGPFALAGGAVIICTVVGYNIMTQLRPSKTAGV